MKQLKDWDFQPMYTEKDYYWNGKTIILFIFEHICIFFGLGKIQKNTTIY